MTSIDPDSILTLRPGAQDDTAAVLRLSDLDSAPMPSGSLLLAVVDGRPVAALSIETGAVVADPFTPTAELIVMLRERAARLGAAQGFSLRAATLGRLRRARRPSAA